MQGAERFLNLRKPTPTAPKFDREAFLERAFSTVPASELIADLSLHDRHLFRLKKSFPAERVIFYSLLPLPLRERICTAVGRAERNLAPNSYAHIFVGQTGKTEYEGLILKADRPYYLFLSYGKKECLFRNLSELKHLKSILPDFPVLDRLIEKNRIYLFLLHAVDS